MFLSDMNYRQVEDYLKTSDTIIIPLGSLENHGLHLPLGTDTIIPDRIAQLINDRSDILIAPTINYGATDDLASFAGTVSLGTEGLTQQLKTIWNSFSALTLMWKNWNTTPGTVKPNQNAECLC